MIGQLNLFRTTIRQHHWADTLPTSAELSDLIVVGGEAGECFGPEVGEFGTRSHVAAPYDDQREGDRDEWPERVHDPGPGERGVTGAQGGRRSIGLGQALSTSAWLTPVDQGLVEEKSSGSISRAKTPVTTVVALCRIRTPRTAPAGLR